MVTISPNNPTGAVYSRQMLTAINTLCHERGVYHISDEAYEHLRTPAPSTFLRLRLRVDKTIQSVCFR